MANPEHLEILKQGVEVWNRWRKDNPDIAPKLEKANLQGIELNGSDLRQADIRFSNLGEADLSEAILNGADLSLAILIKANTEEILTLLRDQTRGSTTST